MRTGAAYVGPARLVRAEGVEPFDTTAGGEPAGSSPRSRARSSGATTPASPAAAGTGARAPAPASPPARRSALFILDVLDPLTDDEAHAAADALTDALRALSPGATVHRRLLGRARGAEVHPC